MMICVDFLLLLNAFHNNFQEIHFHGFRKLQQEGNETFIQKIPEYLMKTQTMYMFVRVERPKGSRRFVLGYVKCDWVFSFSRRFEQIRLLLNRVPPTLLTKVESEENKQLRLACVGQTDYEWAMELYGYRTCPPLVAALEAKNEDAAEALLDGGDDPNKVDGGGRNALYVAAWYGCRRPLFHRILDMIRNVNAVDINGTTALIQAACCYRLDMVVSLMNHPGIDVNVQDRCNRTALHCAILNSNPAILAQLLSDDMVDTSLKNIYNETPLKYAIRWDEVKCVKILREHGAPEE
jgi:ankyrin repeat protein